MFCAFIDHHTTLSTFKTNLLLKISIAAHFWAKKHQLNPRNSVQYIQSCTRYKTNIKNMNYKRSMIQTQSCSVSC